MRDVQFGFKQTWFVELVFGAVHNCRDYIV